MPIMLVKRKIEEVKYFLNKIEEHEHSSEEMMYNLDAFLVMAKSITEFLGKKRNNNLKKWYDEITPKFPLLEYFKDKRDFVIHEGYLDLFSETEINHVEHITVSPSVTIDFYEVDKDGNRIEKNVPFMDDNLDAHDKSLKKVEKITIVKNIDNFKMEILEDEDIPDGATARRLYYFEDFPDKSVIELCNQYFQELVEINRIYGKEQE